RPAVNASLDSDERPHGEMRETIRGPALIAEEQIELLWCQLVCLRTPQQMSSAGLAPSMPLIGEAAHELIPVPAAESLRISVSQLWIPPNTCQSLEDQRALPVNARQALAGDAGLGAPDRVGDDQLKHNHPPLRSPLQDQPIPRLPKQELRWAEAVAINDTDTP